MYNLTNITNSNTIVEIIGSVNEVSGNLIFYLGLFILFIIGLSSFTSVEFKYRFLGVSFICSIISALFLILGWVSLSAAIIPIILMFVGLVIVFFVG